jgi:methionyl-tRNA formyltransferase
MDDGDIVGSRIFEINAHDTIETLHQKNRIAMLQVLTESVAKIAAGAATFTPQPAGEPSYYPKRTPEDGLIDWRSSTRAIDRLIRAVAPPYPGAFAYLEGRRVGISAAQPFDGGLFADDIAAGTIVDASIASRTFVVKTIDGSLLVTRFDGIAMADLRPGARLAGATAATDFTVRYGKDIPPSQWEIGPPAEMSRHE